MSPTSAAPSESHPLCPCGVRQAATEPPGGPKGGWFGSFLLGASHGQNRNKSVTSFSVKLVFWRAILGGKFYFFQCGKLRCYDHFDLLYNLYTETFVLCTLKKNLQDPVRTVTSPV